MTCTLCQSSSGQSTSIVLKQLSQSQAARFVPGDATAKPMLHAAADGVARQAVLVRAVHTGQSRCAVLALLGAPLLCQQLLQPRDGKASGEGVPGV